MVAVAAAEAAVERNVNRENATRTVIAAGAMRPAVRGRATSEIDRGAGSGASSGRGAVNEGSTEIETGNVTGTEKGNIATVEEGKSC